MEHHHLLSIRLNEIVDLNKSLFNQKIYQVDEEEELDFDILVQSDDDELFPSVTNVHCELDFVIEKQKQHQPIKKKEE